jgi:hypothetical protein
MSEPFEEIKTVDTVLYDYLIELSQKITSIEIRLELLEKQGDKFAS